MDQIEENVCQQMTDVKLTLNEQHLKPLNFMQKRIQARLKILLKKRVKEIVYI